MKSEGKSNSNYMDRLPSNNEEIESIQKYSGFFHTKINSLGNLDFSKMAKMHSKGWNMKSSREEVKNLINDFVNIYGLIYRDGKTEPSKLFRGTTKDEVQMMRAGDEIGGALSTSIDEDIAKRFCEYQNAAIIIVRTANSLPHCYIEDLKEDDIENEKEVLILPFSKVKEVEFVSDWKEFKYYNVILEKGELPELSEGTIDELREKCIDEYEAVIQQVKKSEDLKAEYESLSQLNPRNIEERSLINQDKYKIFEEILTIQEKISDYRTNFIQMLKGLCRQREIDIDMQRNETKNKEQERKEAVHQDTTFIRQSLINNVANIIQNIHKYRDISNALGIHTFNSQALEYELNDRVEQIGEELKKIVANEPNIEFELLGELAKRYGNAKQEISGISNFIQEYDENSMLDIKISLNRKIQEMIYRVKIGRLNFEKDSISNKDTFLGKIFGSTKLKQAKIRNVETKMSYAAFVREGANPQNSEEEMLYEVYECAYQYNGGALTEEMLQTERAIRSIFRNLPTSQMLQERVLSTLNIQNQGLQIPSKISKIFNVFHNRRQTEALNNETQIIENELHLIGQQTIQNGQTQGQVITRNLTNIYSKYNNALNNVYTLVKIEDREDQLSTNRNIEEKQI